MARKKDIEWTIKLDGPMTRLGLSKEMEQQDLSCARKCSNWVGTKAYFQLPIGDTPELHDQIQKELRAAGCTLKFIAAVKRMQEKGVTVLHFIE